MHGRFSEPEFLKLCSQDTHENNLGLAIETSTTQLYIGKLSNSNKKLNYLASYTIVEGPNPGSISIHCIKDMHIAMLL